jgi:hypothetical protein
MHLLVGGGNFACIDVGQVIGESEMLESEEHTNVEVGRRNHCLILNGGATRLRQLVP